MSLRHCHASNYDNQNVTRWRILGKQVCVAVDELFWARASNNEYKKKQGWVQGGGQREQPISHWQTREKKTTKKGKAKRKGKGV
jgi:hypothetical protein